MSNDTWPCADCEQEKPLDGYHLICDDFEAVCFECEAAEANREIDEKYGKGAAAAFRNIFPAGGLRQDFDLRDFELMFLGVFADDQAFGDWLAESDEEEAEAFSTRDGYGAHFREHYTLHEWVPGLGWVIWMA